MNKLRLAATLITITSLAFAFQNCQQGIGEAPAKPSGQVGSTSLEVGIVEKIEFIPNTGNNAFIATGSYSIDLSNRSLVFTYYDTNTSQVVGQLDQNLIHDFENFLDQAEVCTTPPPPPGTLCTLIYTSPYATLHTAAQEVRLGEATNGCGNGINFCASADEASFRALLTRALNSQPQI